MRPTVGTAKPYARALHALAKERDQIDAIARDLGTIVDVIDRETGLRDLLSRPWVNAAAKAGLAKELGTRLELSPLARDFLVLVARQGRADHLDQIAAIYRDLVDEDLGRVRARVRTAVPLTDGERDLLRRRLGSAMGGKDVLLNEVVDTHLLGGFVAEIGSYIVDGSLDGQLARLGERLARG